MSRTKAKYVIDTCSLTEMRRRYPEDIFPGAWAKLSELANSGVLVSVDSVLNELESEEAEEDVVVIWAREHRDIFVELDEPIQQEGRRVLSTHEDLVDRKRRRDEADPFVIGLAILRRCAVVTEERRVGPGGRRPNIPNVCEHYGVECINLLEMLRREGLRL